MNPNPLKLGRCIKELERIYGIKNGGARGNQYTTNLAEPKNPNLPNSQEELANEIGISVDKLQRYKKLASLSPELEDLVLNGVVTEGV